MTATTSNTTTSSLSLFERLKTLILLFIASHLVYLAPIFVLFFLYLTYLYPLYCLPIIVAYALVVLRGVQNTEHGAWSWYRRGWKHVYEGTYLHVEPGFKDGQQYLIGYHPHGIYPIGTDAFLLDCCDFDKRFPNIKMRALAASVFFRMPFLREHAMYKGYVDASRPVAERILRKGYSLAIVLGGEREVLEADRNSETITLVLKKRHGFIRLALTNGVSLVPSFAFGQDYLYHQISAFKDLRLWIIKKFAVTITVFWGRFLLLPYKHDVNIVVGNPIPVEKVEKPSQEMIEKYHKIYMDALVDLYNRHKDKYGYGNRKLVIV